MSDFYDQATGKKSLATDDLAFVKRGMSAQELYNSGGGFTPTQAQLDAMNSGITAAKLTADEAALASAKSKTDHIITDSSSKTYYLTPTTPAAPVDGDIWIY